MFSQDKLNSYLEQKYINCNRHPTLPVTIYNYSQTTQFESKWDEVTEACRGLILENETNAVVARPFKKFHNYEQVIDKIPNENFVAYEKMDGSLFILTKFKGNLIYATRGSFVSEQAVKAFEILNTKYAHSIERVEEGKTYLLEIIYPQNRIVVNYGDEEKLVLLAIIDNATGDDLALDDIGFPIVSSYDFKNVQEILKIQDDNREGFVIRFSGGMRVKVKMQEYVRLHRILTGIHARHIWEYLSQGKDLNEILERVPDEFYKWVKFKKIELESKFNQILIECHRDYLDVISEFKNSEHYLKENRKILAEKIIKKSYPGIVFALLDKKKYDNMIWKLIKPKADKPFKTEE